MFRVAIFASAWLCAVAAARAQTDSLYTPWQYTATYAVTNAAPPVAYDPNVTPAGVIQPLPPIQLPAIGTQPTYGEYPPPLDMPSTPLAAPLPVPATTADGNADAPETPPAETVETAEPATDGDSADADVAPDIADDAEEAWYIPNSWFDPTWSGSVEFGLNGTTGNSDSNSYRVAANLRRETERQRVAFDATQARTSSNSVISQNNALANLKYEFLFPESPWTWFVKSTLEYDQFKAFDMRWLANTGVGYQILKNEMARLETRFGSGVSQEVGGPDDELVPEAAFGIDFEIQLTKRQKITTTVDYYPEWAAFGDFRLYTNSGWEVLLDEAMNLSMKVGAIDRYDSTPQGKKPNDLDYLAVLVWKL